MMNNKYFCVFSTIIILFAISFVPANSSPINSIKNNKINIENRKDYSASSINIYELRDLINRLTNKIINNENPKEEIKELLSFPEIKDIILQISDEDTLNTIESLISDKNIFQKFINIYRYKTKIDAIQNDYNMPHFENELNQYIKNNYSMVNSFSVFEESNITIENLEEWLSNWNEYLEENHNLKSIISKYDIYPPTPLFIVFFAVFILIWGFTWGVFSAYNPELVGFLYMIIEGFVLGMASSISMGYLFSLDIPFINNIIQILCNISYINYEEIIAISSSLICLIIVAAFILTCNLSEKFHAICSGLWIILPPIIAAFLLDQMLYY